MLYVAAAERPRDGRQAPPTTGATDVETTPARAGARAGRRRSRPRSRRSRSSTSAARRGTSASTARGSPRAEGRRLPHRARRRLGPGVGVARRLAVRPRVRPNGALLVATGDKGKIYRLEGDPVQPTLLARAAAQQVTALYRDARGRLYYATANPGKLFRLSSEPRHARHLRVRRRATRRWCRPGARSAGTARRRRAAQDRALHALGQHRNAGRHVERLVRRVRQRRGRRRSPARRRATCSGAPC